MSGRVTESIYSGASATIPMAEVSHVDKAFYVEHKSIKETKATHNGYKVYFKHSRWSQEGLDYAPMVFLCLNEGPEFLQAWCQYRHELELPTLAKLEGR